MRRLVFVFFAFCILAPLGFAQNLTSILELSTSCGITQRPRIEGRVWLDLNRNGIQDGEEQGIQGLRLHLYERNTLRATSLTDPNGRYAFSEVYPEAAPLQPFQVYTLRLDHEQDYLDPKKLLNAWLAPRNMGEDDQDSDATLSRSEGILGRNTFPELQVVTQNCGQTSKAADFGFRQPRADVKITAQMRIFGENGKEVSQECAGCTVWYRMEATNQGPDAATGLSLELPKALQSDLPKSFIRAVVTQGAYDEAAKRWLLGNMEPGTVASIVIQMKVIGL